MTIECRTQQVFFVLASFEEKESSLQEHKIYEYSDQLKFITKEKKSLLE